MMTLPEDFKKKRSKTEMTPPSLQISELAATVFGC
jgi:hypothetical protein